MMRSTIQQYRNLLNRNKNLLHRPKNIGIVPLERLLGVGAVAKAADGDHVQCAVGLTVAAGVEPVSRALSRCEGDGAGATQCGERAFTLGAFDVLAGGDQQLTGLLRLAPQMAAWRISRRG